MISMCHMHSQLDGMKSFQSTNSSPTYYMYAINRVVQTPIDFALELCSQQCQPDMLESLPYGEDSSPPLQSGMPGKQSEPKPFKVCESS